MAIELVKSTAVTNADASPTQAFNSTKILGGRLKGDIGTGALSATASIGSVIRFTRVWSGWRIHQILLWCTAITAAAGDLGLYETAANGGAVVDADFFASAVSLAAVLQGTDVTHEAAGTGNHYGDLTKSELMLWQALGLSADPGKYYDIALTLTAAATAAGTVVAKVSHLDGN